MNSDLYELHQAVLWSEHKLQTHVLVHARRACSARTHVVRYEFERCRGNGRDETECRRNLVSQQPLDLQTAPP